MICLWDGILNSLSSFVQKCQIEKTKLELKTKSVIIVPSHTHPTVLNYFLWLMGLTLLAAEEVERQMPASFLALKSYYV